MEDGYMTVLSEDQKLTGTDNYRGWKRIMRALLTFRGLRDYVDGTIKRPDEDESSKVFMDWEEYNTAAYSCIANSVTGYPRKIVLRLSSSTAAEVWAHLEANYQLKGFHAQYIYTIELLDLKLNESKDIELFNSAFRNSIKKLTEVGMDSTIIFCIILYMKALRAVFPIWADRQTHRLCQETKLTEATLKELISDATQNCHDQTYVPNKPGKQNATQSKKGGNRRTDKNARKPKGSRRKEGKKHCETCDDDRHNESECWSLHPELTPEWAMRAAANTEWRPAGWTSLTF